MTEKEILDLCDIVRETSFELQRFLRHGHLEKVYERGLAHRLSKKGLSVKQQFPLKVTDEDGTTLEEFIVDLLLEDKLIVELKACKTLANEHIAQMLGYLRATNLKHGLLVNFGSPKL